MPCQPVWLWNYKMRHTLLPLHERIILRREYHVRVTIVFLFMVCVATLIGIASLLPTYIDAKQLEKDILAKSVKGNEEQSADIKEFQKNVARSLSLLDKSKEPTTFSNVIYSVISMRGALRFNNFAINKTGTTTYSIQIQGVAPNRTALLNFKTNFEGLGSDNKVDLPVSELAKSSNIQFSIQLKQNVKYEN